jgi:hypothetical protein
MSERWQEELKKLRRLETPAGLWERAQEPPSSDRLPPRRERIVAAVVAIVVFVAAGAFAFEALRPSGRSNARAVDETPIMVAHFFLAKSESTPEYPDANLTFEGQTQNGYGTSWGWDLGDGGTYIADTGTPEFKDKDYLQIPSGTVLRITGDASSVEGSLQEGATFPFDVVKNLGVVEGDTPLASEAGRYVLELRGSWPQGGRDFYFAIEIVPSGGGPSTGIDSPPDVARVVCDEGGTEVLTPVVAAQSDGLHLVFENQSGAKAFDLHPVNSKRGVSVGGALESSGETTSRGFSLDPGEVQVACLPTMNDSYLEQPTATLTIEDPDGLWIPVDPACTGATIDSSGTIGDVYGLSNDQLESAIRQALTGILESDEVLKPGYPETGFKALTLVVRRGGVIVANVWVAGGLHLSACEDSGIAVAPAPDPPPLDCSALDQIAFEHTGGVDEPAGEAFIRVNTVGILPSDELTHIGPPSGPTGDDGIWTVMRNGAVVAWVDYPDLNGVACVGSGIGGVA